MSFLSKLIKKKKEGGWETEEIDVSDDDQKEIENDDSSEKEVEESVVVEEEKEIKEKKESSSSGKQCVEKKSWMKKEGELVVDVYETENNIVIQTPIAGVKREDLEIVTEKDMITIKGKRERPEKDEIKGFYTNECFFGNFKREIILPEETDPSRIEASMEEGVLSISIPKIEREKRRKVNL